MKKLVIEIDLENEALVDLESGLDSKVSTELYDVLHRVAYDVITDVRGDHVLADDGSIIVGRWQVKTGGKYDHLPRSLFNIVD